MTEQFYQSTKNPDKSDRAVIVLPEIFGMNKFIISTTDRLAEELGVKAFALDHFFPVTGKSQVFSYDDHEAPMGTMQQLSGRQFLDFFIASLDEVTQNNPEVKSFTVVGFCFGGKLAFLAGTDRRVTQIASFYGSRSVQGDFYEGKSVLEALTTSRASDSSLSVMGLFGASDPSLPAEAREETKKAFTAADISYQERVYDAGHAFMNYERTNMHSSEASKLAWADLVNFLQS